jgi:NAD(P)-dependent dehydrogenase (short-subunit alcohol dehydrogenase family)
VGTVPTPLDGRVAIVTGSAGGLGLETAKVLAEAGAAIVLADLPGSDLDGAARAVGQIGRAAHCSVDISDEASVERLIRFTLETLGQLDVLVNNAARQGLRDDTDVLSMSVDVWDSIFAVNARGTMLMAKHALPALFESDAAAIVNIGSGMANAGDDTSTAYACTKAAIQTITYYLATQNAARGVRCNCVAPGLINTATLQASMPESLRDVIIESMSLARLAEPVDVARAVLFLASEQSSYLTGQVLHVDGGYFSHLPHVPAVRNEVARLAD